MEKERWVKIPGFPEHYEISTLAQVRVLDYVDAAGRRRKGQLLTPSRHCLVQIYGRPCAIGRLMLLTFKGPPPPGKGYARHLNDDQWDNVLENLAWGSPKDNYDDAVRNGSLGKGSLAAIAGGFKRWGNTNARGNTNWLGRKHTEQTKAKIQEKMRGNTNALGSTHRLGRKHTEQSKEKMRAAHAVHKVLKEFLG